MYLTNHLNGSRLFEVEDDGIAVVDRLTGVTELHPLPAEPIGSPAGAYNLLFVLCVISSGTPVATAVKPSEVGAALMIEDVRARLSYLVSGGFVKIHEFDGRGRAEPTPATPDRLLDHEFPQDQIIVIYPADKAQAWFHLVINEQAFARTS